MNEQTITVNKAENIWDKNGNLFFKMPEDSISIIASATEALKIITEIMHSGFFDEKESKKNALDEMLADYINTIEKELCKNDLAYGGSHLTA